MTERMKAWWDGLTRRERWLVAIAGALAAGILVWALARPVFAAFASLEADHRAAVEREGRVSAKIDLLAARGEVEAATPAVGALDQYLALSAGEIGLTLDRNEARGDAQATIAIASAKAPVLIDWLASLEAQGFIVDQLVITPTPDGNVGMTAELRRAGS